ncbi:MAG: hypothetical protein GY834_13140 [Bacteroidetes bacterium]|nr:hypothetical protein [Bacteroidota bacterium]
MTPDEIELYKDIVKIGIPALAGLLAGLIPYVLERNKLHQEAVREGREFKRNQIIELIDCFSKFSGNLSAYISRLLSMKYSGGEKFYSKLVCSGDNVLLNEVNLTKAKVISGLIGGNQLVEAFHEYDRQTSAVINLLAKPEGISDDKKKQVVAELKKKENELIVMFNELS